MILIFSRYWWNKRSDKEINDRYSNKIRQPKVYLYMGIGGLTIFIAIGLFFLLAPEKMIANYEDGVRLPVFLVFLTICIPYVFIILLQVNWEIDIGNCEFSFKNIWGTKRNYKFDEIKIKKLSRCTRFYRMDKLIVGISIFQENWDALEKAIMSYKKELKKIL